MRESPRQKLINMMYLVLIATLALNVSQDVLDAFVMVDEGLNTTTGNFASKNSIIYEQMARQASANPVKAGPWNEKALQVRSQADALVAYVQELKRLIVRTADGEDAEALTDPYIIDVAQIKAKDNTSIPAEIMIFKKNGRELRTRIESFRETLVSMAGKESGTAASIARSLNTSDRKRKIDESRFTWESYYFENLPLMAVLTNMSKIQTDIRNAEAEIIRHLMEQIDVGDFKFNKLEAVVTSNTGYVLQGGSYQAQVMLAVYDSTRNPTFLVGPYRSRKLPDGTLDYEMTGRFDSLKVVNGKGLYQANGQPAGNYTLSGLIQVRNPDGSFTRRPFSSTYQVGTPSAVISPTKMNVLYLNVDNPVSISVSGVPAESIRATVDNGELIRKDQGYIARPKDASRNAIITVTAPVDGKVREMGKMLFRVRTVPDPVAKVAGRKGGVIDKSTLSAQVAVQAELENFEFEMKFTVTEFKVSAIQGTFLREYTSRSARFTPEQKQLINSLGKNTKVYIEEIKASGTDGTTRDLAPVVFRIN